MRPALRSGDLVLVRRGEVPSRGEVALIDRRGHGLVLHRVVAIQPHGSLRTRGDANPVEDMSPVAREEVAGTMAAVVPVGRLLERWQAR